MTSDPGRDAPFPPDPPAPADDRFAMDDAAYVLGALSPDRRAAFEAHLSTCRRCARSVAELAGLPGLLGRVSPEVALGLDSSAHGSADAAERPGTPVPPIDLVPTMLARARRQRAGRRLRMAAGTFAAVAALVTAFLVGGALRAQQEPPKTVAEALALTPVTAPTGPAEVSATAHLASVRWGTRIELECRYDPGTEGPPSDEPPTYRLVVLDGQGRAQDVGSWVAVPGREVTVPGATSLRRDDIDRIEVRSATGAPLLRSDA